MNDTARLAPLARVHDEDLAGSADTLPGRALLASLTQLDSVAVAGSAGPSAPPLSGSPLSGSPRRWRLAVKLALASTVVAAVTAVAVVAPSLLAGGTGGATSYASAAIDVRLEGRFYVARIKDPLADRARFVEAFRAVGKDVTIDLVPVSPRYVGQWLSASSEANTAMEVSTELVPANGEDCAVVPDKCVLVIRISADTAGSVRYTFGRAARPGEALQDPSARDDSLPSPPAGSGSGSGSGSSGGK
jgi:hypothetical protein